MSPPSSSYAREKLVHAIIFFTKNTRACGKLKLFKLLYLFDFAIFRETGRTATGLEYFAWPMGPVPTELFEELDHPRADMSAALLIRKAPDSEPDPDFKNRGLRISGRIAFDESFFSARELDRMAYLAEIYLEATAKMMTEATHLSGAPWHQVFEVQKKPQALIPYLLALDTKPGSITREQAEVIEQETREVEAILE